MAAAAPIGTHDSTPPNIPIERSLIRQSNYDPHLWQIVFANLSVPDAIRSFEGIFRPYLSSREESRGPQRDAVAGLSSRFNALSLQDQQAAIEELGRENRFGAIRTLLMRSNSESIGSLEGNGLLQAADGNRADLVRELIENPRTLARIPNEFLGWAIQGAASNGHTGIVRLMIENPEVLGSISDFSELGKALWFAARKGHTGIVELFLGNPRILSSLPNDDLGRALWRASSMRRGDVVRLLRGNEEVMARIPSRYLRLSRV